VIEKKVKNAEEQANMKCRALKSTGRPSRFQGQDRLLAWRRTRANEEGEKTASSGGTSGVSKEMSAKKKKRSGRQLAWSKKRGRRET